MEKVKFTKLDGGNISERIAEAKEFFGLKPDQSFQDIVVDDEDKDYK